MSRRRGPTGTAGEVHGQVARGPIALGSKSAHEALGVVGDDGAFVVVHVVGDTPFEEKTMVSLIGRRVSAHGLWRNGTLLVQPTDLAPAEAPPDVTAAPSGGSGGDGA